MVLYEMKLVYVSDASFFCNLLFKGFKKCLKEGLRVFYIITVMLYILHLLWYITWIILLNNDCQKVGLCSVRN